MTTVASNESTILPLTSNATTMDASTTSCQKKIMEDSSRTASTFGNSSSCLLGEFSNADLWNMDLDDVLDNMPDTPSVPPSFRRVKSFEDVVPVRNPKKAPANTSNDKTERKAPVSPKRVSRERITREQPKIILSPKRTLSPKRGVRRTKSNDMAATPFSALKRGVRRTKSNEESAARLLAPKTRQLMDGSSVMSMSGTGSTRRGGRRTRTQSPKRDVNGQPPRRNVSFDKVQVREFQQILGDNPCKDNGPSLGLGWDFHQKKDTDLEKFESKRNWNGGSTVNRMLGQQPRRSRDCLTMSPKAREERLRKLGYSQEEIETNRAWILKINKQRQKSATETHSDNPDVDNFDPVAFFREAQKSHKESHEQWMTKLLDT